MGKINVPGWFGANLYCIVLLLYIYFSSKNKKFIVTREMKTYGVVVWVVALSLIADTLSRFYSIEELRNSMYPIIVFGTYLKYILIPLILPTIYRYYLFQLKGRASKKIKVIYCLGWIAQAVSSLMVITTAWTRYVFYYDANQIYHRGSLYYVFVLIMLSVGIVSEISIIKNKKLLSPKNYIIFSTIVAIPIIGMFIQMFFYGLAFGQMGVSFAVLVIYVNIVSKDIHKDHLTSLSDREYFEAYLDDYILDETNYPFAALLIDMDDFKNINDEYGHVVGDDAIKNAATVVRNALRNNDIVARYGGDEFVALLRNCDKKTLMMLIDRINNDLRVFNERSDKSYVIRFSIGGMVYEKSFFEEGINSQTFIEMVDEKMYEAKRINKGLKNNSFSSNTVNSL